MFIKNKSILLVGTLLLSNQLFGQTTLDEVVVTANKTEQKLSQTAKVMIVLSDSILQKYQGQTVAELLSKQAGFTVVGSNGPLGSNQEMYLRGAGTGNTLILIDGVPAYDPSYINNGFDLNMLSVCECDRIEILKGSQSSLYGSDAVAGVINIFTKKSKSEKAIAGSISSNAGSFNTFRNTLNLNGLTGKLNYSLQYTNLVSKGFSAAFDKQNKGFEKDGYKQNNFQGNIGIQISNKLNIRLKGLVNNYKSDLDAGPFTDEKDYTTTQKLWLAGGGIDLKTTKGKLVMNYTIGENNRLFVDDSSYVAEGAFNNYAKSTFGGITQFADIYWTNSLSKSFDLVLGADFRNANLEQTYVSYSQFGKYDAEPINKDSANSDIYSLYATGLFKTKSLFVEIGARFNSHSIYGSNFTYSFNPSYLINKNVKLYANMASAFKAPSLYQLYSPYGNKNLKPETTQSAEFGFQLSCKNQGSTIRFTYFDRNQSDVIFFQSQNTFPYGKYINFDKQNDSGLEIEANYIVGNINIWGNYTYLLGKITTKIAGKDTTFNNLFRRPKNAINLGIGYQISRKLYVSSTMRAVGERTDRFYNSAKFKTENVKMNSYVIFDITANYKCLKNLNAYLDIKNITDKTYTDSYGYGVKPFNFMLGLSYGF